MPLQATSGAASYDGFGGGVAVEPNYIESVFSTYLYTGTGASQTITNGIDLSGKGGLVWTKRRNSALSHILFDTVRGADKALYSDLTSAQDAGFSPDYFGPFNSTGYGLSLNATQNQLNQSAGTYVSWTFRKQPKFFDVVTYSGSSSTQNIAHNLGSVPGCIIVKRTSGVEDWFVYHTSLGNTQYLKLNGTGAAASGFAAWNNTSPTSTQFTVLGGRTEVNAAGSDYVAYLFAHNAGGFGLTGTDNVISCGTFTTDGSGKFSVNLGYEPQWIMIKLVNGTSNWSVFDNMRGMPVGSPTTRLLPNLSDAESSAFSFVDINATGFAAGTGSGNPYTEGQTWIYIAIRRGPMKVPTSGTSVFAVSTASGEPAYSPLFTAGFSDMTLHSPRVSESGNGHLITDRLRGNGVILETPYTNAENTISTYFKYDSNDGAYIPNIGYFNNTGGTSKPYALRAFRRAPSFFDEVCYTGTGSQQNITHNLGVAPELIFVKSRSAANGGLVYNKTITASKYLKLFFTSEGDRAVSNDTGGFAGVEPTSSVFTVGTYNNVNGSGSTYVAYLFASCAAVSKVFNYTGNGSSQTINCGFTGGARLVLIKRTDAIGDWYVWDSARGIVSGNDPHLSLNTTDAEVTTDDTIDTDSTGFVVNQVSATNVNVSSATYIGIAIA